MHTHARVHAHIHTNKHTRARTRARIVDSKDESTAPSSDETFPSGLCVCSLDDRTRAGLGSVRVGSSSLTSVNRGELHHILVTSS